MQDEQVGRLQRYLARLGHLTAATPEPAARAAAFSSEMESGQFGEETAAALRSYQAYHGLPVTGTLDEATITEMSLPRCGNPDRPRQRLSAAFSLQGNRWPSTRLTYSIGRFSRDLPQSQVRDAMRRAFGLWSRVTPLTFSEVDPNGPADIRISFVSGEHGDGEPLDGEGNVLAHAFFPPPNAGELAGDAHFDEAETWSVDLPASGVDLMTVAAHEFGHSLGLEHSDVRGALMFPSYSGPQRFLAQDDVRGIRALYGRQQ